MPFGTGDAFSRRRWARVTGPPRRLCSSPSPFASCFTFFFIYYRFIFCGLSDVLDPGGCYDGDKSFDSSLGFLRWSSLPVWPFLQRWSRGFSRRRRSATGFGFRSRSTSVWLPSVKSSCRLGPNLSTAYGASFTTA
ncbi:unnamed protein product [Brassica rapa subsp. narinosa]